jgi:hypothetical protein
VVPYSQEVSEPPTHGCEDVHSQYKVGISKLQSDISRALLRGHASSQSTARRLYTAAVATTQRTVTRAVSARADKVPAALHEPTRLRATNRRRQPPADRDRMDARCGKLPAPLTGSVALSAVTKGAAAAAAAYRPPLNCRASSELVSTRPALTRACERAARTDASCAPHRPRETRAPPRNL